jgi:putative ABC transport system substrate-binding protein
LNRRSLLASLAAGPLLWTRLVLAQPQQSAYRIGFVASTIPNADLVARRNTHPAPRIIEESLRELGWVDGKNVQLLWKSSDNHPERTPAIIEEFVRMPVDVLVVFNNRGAELALKETRHIPIVIIAGSNLVAGGLVASLARPGGNLTGLSYEGTANAGKLLQLLKDAAPRVTRVALLGAPSADDPDRETQDAARELGLVIFLVRYEGEEVESAVVQAVHQGANGLVFLGKAALQWRHVQEKAHEASARHRLPAIHAMLTAVESGGLMAYSALIDKVVIGRASYFIDRILRGAKPSELPIEQHSKFELHLNLGTARKLGLVFPASLITRADRVFQ